MKKLLLTTAATLFSIGTFAAHGEEALIYEDFSKFTAGTQEAADETNVGTTADDPYGNGDLDSYTLTPGWMAYGIYQAGGTAVLKGIDVYGAPYSAMSSNQVAMNGNVRIKVKARLYPESSTPTDMRMLLMSDRWQQSDIETVSVTSEWQEFILDTKVSDGNWQVRLDLGDGQGNISPVQFALIEVTERAASTEKPAAPEAVEPTRVTDTSFTAWWNRVKGVDTYKVYVTYEENGQTRQFGEPYEVTLKSQWSDPAKRVEGLDPEVIYSYYVTAVSDGLESDPSNVIEVLSLSRPDVNMASDITDNSFKASWNKVHKATGYDVNLYCITPQGRRLEKTVSVTDTSCEFKDLDTSVSNYWGYDVTATLTHKGEVEKSAESDIRGALFNADDLRFKEAVNEDFSKFSNGSVDNIYYRESDESDTWGEYVNNFQTEEIPDTYTTQPGWTGFAVAEAGGMAAISYKPYPNSYQGGHIMTPGVAGHAVVRLRFRAAPIPQYFTVSEETPMVLPLYLISKNTDFDSEIFSSSMPMTTEITDDEFGLNITHSYKVTDADWHEYEVTYITHSDNPVNVQIGGSPSTCTPFFIDDIKVEVAMTSIAAPKAWDADNFTKDGFTAYWSEVLEAESYLVSVFHRKAGKDVYEVEDLEFTETEGVITGLDPWSDWLFTVKAKLGAVVSEPSEPLAAIGVSTPEIAEATEATADGFTANWVRTPKATRYDLTIYRMEGENPVELQKVEIEDGETVSYKVEGLEKDAVRNFGYALKAYYDTSSDTYESGVSPVYSFNLDTLGIGGVAAAECGVKAVNGLIVIEAAVGTAVTVSDVAGRVLYDGVMVSDSLPASQALYIVKVGSQVFKVMI